MTRSFLYPAVLTLARLLVSASSLCWDATFPERAVYIPVFIYISLGKCSVNHYNATFIPANIFSSHDFSFWSGGGPVPGCESGKPLTLSGREPVRFPSG